MRGSSFRIGESKRYAAEELNEKEEGKWSKSWN